MTGGQDCGDAPATGLMRRTTIELGPLRITRERVIVALPTGVPALARPRRRVWPALLAAAAATSLGGLAVGATRLPPRASYSVSVPVPERVVVPTPATRPAPPRSSHSAPAARSPADLTADTADTDDAATVLSGRVTRAAAVAAALRTGEMSEWQQPDGTRGFVVAGAAEAEDRRRCRALSVLTRSAGGDTVDQLRACLPAGRAAE